ncbi:unnamed protein product [Paramecium pentaurelia]|uniref:PPM-type phosphatase domain-containing protein n=1 Tax=Paramecium pentaurelia TaxID=43138 RepID=A0A8S1SWD3_9CILI|nr:unnamed protein product [Paramecium pentaurelia]
MKLVNIHQSIRSKSENRRQTSREQTNTDHKYKLPQLMDKQISQKTFKKPPLQQKSRRIINSKIPKLEIQLYYGSLSKAGFDGFCEKTNQDREFAEIIDDEQGIFAVMDGHGTDGDQISTFVRDYFQQYAIKDFKTIDFVKLFANAHSNVASHSHFDSLMSGTTATLIVIRDQVIHCAWVGDSRAILCSKQQNKLITTDLSIDHKPHLLKEKKRIENQGGAVNTYKLQNGQSVGPSRVYIKGASFPGLAMSRSIGDQIAEQVGVSHVPDIKQHQITRDDLFIIIGSDGLWEFLDNNQIVEITHQYFLNNDPQGACQKLIQESKTQWKKFSEGVDDITVIVVFLQNSNT